MYLSTRNLIGNKEFELFNFIMTTENIDEEMVACGNWYYFDRKLTKR